MVKLDFYYWQFGDKQLQESIVKLIDNKQLNPEELQKVREYLLQFIFPFKDNINLISKNNNTYNKLVKEIQEVEQEKIISVITEELLDYGIDPF